MAHNIAVINGRAAMAYAGGAARTPWHGLGEKLNGLTSLEAALAAAGLDYTVELQDVYMGDGRVIDSSKVAVRLTGDGSPSVDLGVVGTGYTVIQNTEAAEILRPMVEEFGCTVEAAGALGKGERCWILLRMKDATVTPVPGDDVRGYFLLHWSHNGQVGLCGLGTPIRVVCQNTLTMATGNGRKAAWVSIRHTASAPQRLDEAAKLLARFMAALEATGETFAQLAAQHLNRAGLQAYVDAVIPQDGAKLSPVLKARRDTIVQLAYDGRGAAMANQLVDVQAGEVSAWAAFNAVAEDFDHTRAAEAKSEAGLRRAQESAIFGANAEVKAQALQLAQAMLTAA